jgi:hypothetical protein
MKNLICVCRLILSILLLSIILQSCSPESGVTSPPESKTKIMAKEVVLPTSTMAKEVVLPTSTMAKEVVLPTSTMAKEVVLPISTINPITDTAIVLPKSGKTIVVSKKYSAAIIAAIDDYLKNHPNISFNPNLSVKPDAVCPNYPLYAVRTWVYQ